MPCPACGNHDLEFDDQILSLLCTNCGNVVESSQSALDFSMTTEKGTGTNFGMGRALHNQSSTLVARSGRYLGSDTREARWIRNLEATKSFLAAVTRNMHQLPCTERAQYIMEQAMKKGRFRWGRSAERVAGASICLALRESGRAESIREVAVHIQCRQEHLARTHRRVAILLSIKIEPLDPALLVSSIWNYTQECLTASASLFPTELSKFLSDLTSFSQSVLNLAHQLSNLILRVSLTNGRQSNIVACALFMVSLSGQAGKPIPKPGVLASVLGDRFGGAARSIADRIREIERLIEDWRHELPWADTDLPANSRKRTIKVATWIKDVIHFKDDLWSKQIEAVAHAHYSPSIEDDFDEGEDDTSSCTGSYSTVGSKRSSNGTQSTSNSKRPHLDRGYYDSGRPRAYVVEQSKARPSAQATILASLLDPFSCSISTPSTLGSAWDELKRSDSVADEDLFEEGELERLIRSDEDVRALRARWEAEGRFEGIPEWIDEPQEVPPDLVNAGDLLDAFDPDVEELVGAWRGPSPTGFDDNNSYFYDD
ncbi:unnamed protein product [Rhizoctonia solani]|uniref:DNA-templated transcriptional preinitiation complex assembly n=2 Tax=Rhizoctonia solani TaxID=456999 RepID=A0A8H7LLC2_9AGAM|nr:DNA-templated transcriptional preinitiation complex assembly [Rhizoctonia solani]CAE6489632.1 unnamed protein product [Rhizoctonia solani]